MTTAQICIILAIGIYLIAMIGIGLFFNRSGSASSNDFYLGGRSLGPVVTAMSAEASDMSSYRPGRGHLPQLADRSQAPAALFRRHRGHYHPRLLLTPLR